MQDGGGVGLEVSGWQCFSSVIGWIVEIYYIININDCMQLTIKRHIHEDILDQEL